MKYIIVISDGMGDYPIESLNNRTPLEAANVPNMDYLAQNGEIGMAKTTSDGLSPGSDVTNLAILGYDPERYYTGRSPFEAASMGVSLHHGDISYRCNLVTLRDIENGYNFEQITSKVIMDDYSAGHITSEDAKVIIREINNQLGTEHIQFYSGISYRHLMVWTGGKISKDLTPPHDISGKKVIDYLSGGNGGDIIRELIESSIPILQTSPINRDRIEAGKSPANSIWLWGEGKRPNLPEFRGRYGLSCSMISAVDLMKGIGIYAGLDIINVPGATGYLDTNYRGKGEYGLEELKKKDMIYIHIEAPDEAGHNGDIAAKVKAIESIDDLVLGTILNGVENIDDEYKIMILCDHRTPIVKKTHTDDPVPFLIYNSLNKEKSSGKDFNEKNAETGLFIEKGYRLMEYFTRR
ncbi:MAG: cofactor-independent phosphoglycerate mutase [Nitrospirota bacterium]